MHTPIENIFTKLQSKQEKNLIITVPFPHGQTTVATENRVKPHTEKHGSFPKKTGGEKVKAGVNDRLKKRENSFSRVHLFRKYGATLSDPRLWRNELPKATQGFFVSNAAHFSPHLPTPSGIDGRKATQSTSKEQVVLQGKKRKNLFVKSAYTVNTNTFTRRKKRIIISRGKVTPRREKFHPSPLRRPLTAKGPYVERSAQHTPFPFFAGKGNAKQQQRGKTHPSSFNSVSRAPLIQRKEQKGQLSPRVNPRARSEMQSNNKRFAENTLLAVHPNATPLLPATAAKAGIGNAKHQQRVPVLPAKENTFSIIPPTFALRSPKARPRNAVDFILATIYIQSTHNNTIYTLTDHRGKTRGWTSAGTCGFKNTRKATSYASQAAAEKCASLAKSINCTALSLKIQGLGPGKLSGVRTIHQSGLRVSRIWECTTLPHNGCRQKKSRRI